MPQPEILWDAWGVPHVYAENDADAFRGLGWGQARAHGRLLAKLYALARGEAAAVWGEKYAESDRFIRRFGIPSFASAWIERQDPGTLEAIESFVAGVNAAFAAHPGALDDEARSLLPITVNDVFAHVGRVYLVYLTQLGQRPAGEAYNDLLPYSTILPDVQAMGTGIAGSNAWALSKTRTASGRGMLLANPHLYWGDFHTFFEAHLVTPNTSVYGVAQVGWPVLRYGFNRHLGWAHTVNTLKGWDAFELKLEGDGYVLDGEVTPFETHEETLRIGEREETLVVRRTAHGPVVIDEEHRKVAVRCVGFQVTSMSGLFAQYWAMANARTHAEFEAALGRASNPMFNVLYADREGRAASYFTGFVPRRAGGTWTDWAGTLRGDDSALIWNETHAFDELPRVVDPPSGFVQNANNPPWLTTLPAALTKSDFPAYLAPWLVTPREGRSLKMLAALEGVSLDDVVRCTFDTTSETAERLLPDLLTAASTSDSDVVREAARVLGAWDRRYAEESVGADLFARWLVLMAPSRDLGNIAAEGWTWNDPTSTPRGLADPDRAVRCLKRAAASLFAETRTLERRWGDVTRARRGAREVPGHGHLDPFGVFRVSGFTRSGDGRFDVAFGTTYVAAVEFADPVRAKVLLAYGNSSQPDSPHNGDQLSLFARGEMRDALLTREDVEAKLAEREVL
ncbi:penicillin acylase family protein [Deinococcus yavapaiensis]|uniref:Acyl-homoserine-lactone acylase n=1 Tax=Deinococcus yavapaiensis KR-236 TaxID=694435 RepID=A0A318SD86_9DEIO|nr:penicillin acylase family protein [Deinococcus yavapaiensis]PYE54861.1 acyl-homoserine-lactone acylase [Deinococcus yavapaiensis KR-236]